MVQMKDFDDLDQLENDMMAETDTFFNYEKEEEGTNVEILDQVKKFINTLIMASRQDKNKYKNILEDIVEIVANEDKEKDKKLSEHEMEKFKEAHQFKVGVKIPEDYPLIDDFGSERLIIESTQIFRFLIKWIEDLSKVVESKGTFLEEIKELKVVEMFIDIHEPPQSKMI